MSEFQHDKTQTNQHCYKDIFQGIGALIGFLYAIHAAIYLSTENMASIPYAGDMLAKYLSLGFYQCVVPILLVGTFANYYSNLGIAIDVIIQRIKISSDHYRSGNFIFGYDQLCAKSIGHVVGALFGMAIAIFFIYCNYKNPAASFSLPFGAAKGVPNTFLQIGAVLYISGACSNLFSHFTEGMKNSFKGTKHISGKIGSRITSFNSDSSAAE